MELGSPIPHKHARIEIIPLIDIMFFLLASFMMVSLSQVQVRGIKMDLPSGTSGEVQNKKDYISLSVDRDGFFYFDKEKMEYTDVTPRLALLYQQTPEAKVFVRGDREALHGNVTRLLELIRASGFTKIAFEIKSEATAQLPGTDQ
jgi:biopolymer transport protein ExbD